MNEGLFLRKEGKGRMSYEVAFNHAAFNVGREYYDEIADGPGYVLVSEDFRTHAYAIALKSDFRLTKNADARLRQYAGFQLRPTLLSQSMHQNVYDAATLQPVSGNATENGAARNLRVWAGIQYTACYVLNSRLTIRAVAAYQIERVQLWSYEYTYWSRYAPHGKASLDFGIAYLLH